MRAHRSERPAAGHVAWRPNQVSMQEERSQLRDLIASLAPYHPGGLEDAARRILIDREMIRSAPPGQKRAGADDWVGPLWAD